MSVFPAEPAHDDRPLATLRYLAGVTALAISYYATGLLGLSLFSVDATAPIWLPTAIALAVLVLFGLRYWPAVAIGSFVLGTMRGRSVDGAAIVAMCAVLETCAGAFLLVRVLKFRPQLDRVRDAIAFSGVAVVTTALASTILSGLLLATDHISSAKLGDFWSTWWWTHLSGYLVVTPAILTVAHRSRMPRQSQGVLEAFVLALASFGMVLAVLARWLPSMMELATPPYYVLPMLLWAGLRFGPRGAALASLSTNIVAIVAQELGVGPFDGLLDLQSFVTISTVGTLLVSTLALERVRALEANERNLRFAHTRLEAEVVQRTAELTAANKALARRDELMRQATALARLGSFEYDLVSRRMMWSEELFALLGRDPKTFEPSLEAFMHSVTLADRQKVEAQLTYGFAHLRTFELTAHIKRPDNGERALDISIRMFSDGNSRPVRAVGCCQDITEREAADRHRAQLAQLVESSDDAIIGLTPSGTVMTWNFGAQEVFGYSASDMIGRLCSKLVTSAEREHHDQVLAAVRGGNHIAHHYVACVRKNGEVFPASVTTSAVLDENRDVIGISKVIRDITSQQEVEAQLRASLHEKEVLLREIHHRVKNNLQVIASLLRLETSTSETAHQALVDSQNRIHSMAMIHQLLYQSKDFAHVDFQQYLLQLAERLGQAYGSSERIPITVRCTLGDQLTVDQAIPCALILNELVTNALTHAFPSDRTGAIDIDVETDLGEVTMIIRDNGIGIAAEAQRNNGMGFRIVRTLAVQLGGTLEVRRDDGTIVTVSFPLERSTIRKSRPIVLNH